MNNIYNLAVKAKKISEQLQISRNNIIDQSRGIRFVDYDINGEVVQYHQSLHILSEAVKVKYPDIHTLLEKHLSNYNHDKIIHLSALNAIVECLCTLETPSSTAKKIFISHSSKDIDVIERFVDNILRLGIGISAQDIFCTSIEDMTMNNGEDIRKHIQENIRNAEFSFLLISENYKQSKICLNEMGAVWAYDANVRLYLLPNTAVEAIGWLCDPRKADNLASSTALDILFNELTTYYGLEKDIVQWGKQRENFLQSIGKIGK